jgi:endonuclease/exonuclease/phosphatase (EEP) superfamily protein YafD
MEKSHQHTDRDTIRRLQTMKSCRLLLVVRDLFVIAGWLYVVAIVTWLFLSLAVGERFWWLIVVNSFVPWFFLPLPLFLLLARLLSKRFLLAGLALPVFVFGVLYGPLFLPNFVRQPASAGSPLSVMSFNLWGGSRSVKTAAAIEAAGWPDLVAVQELTPTIVDVLLDFGEGVYTHHLLPSLDEPRNLGLLSRYPLTAVDVEHLNGTGCAVQAARVELPEGKIILYNLRLDSSNVLVYLEEQRPLAAEVRTSNELRYACIERVITDLRVHLEPVLLVGDFNSTDQSEIYRLLRHDFRDAHRTVGWGFGHTFPAYAGRFRGLPILPRQMRIDMIFYDAAFRALDCHVVPIYGESDHLPVVARLWLPVGASP